MGHARLAFSRVLSQLRLKQKSRSLGAMGLLVCIFPFLLPTSFLIFHHATRRFFSLLQYSPAHFLPSSVKLAFLGGKEAICRGDGSRAQKWCAAVVPTSTWFLERIWREMSCLLPSIVLYRPGYFLFKFPCEVSCWFL